MVVVLIIAFALSAVITIYLIFRTGATRVPPIVGKTQVEAQTLAEKAGLQVKIQLRPDPGVPKNQVIETRPVQNSSVKKDSTVVIVVSSGPAVRSGSLLLPMLALPGMPGRGFSVQVRKREEGTFSLEDLADYSVRFPWSPRCSKY
ncbi:MAG: PASTA domain-containing protein [Blastocatellia bacterium]